MTAKLQATSYKLQTTSNNTSKKSFFSKNFLLLTVCCLLFVAFLVEFLYAWKLKMELTNRERQLEQAVASQEKEDVVTPAMLREEIEKEKTEEEE